jgi:hypothetical protein
MQEGRMIGIVSKEDMTQEHVMSLATQKAQVTTHYQAKGIENDASTIQD